mmetsp:Transcript_15933/g.47919  ORF Transcript_15933/g.47919 Transcript_15933/m.47919 type:complete len:373 (+) Transcript_15933:97-1215(+)
MRLPLVVAPLLHLLVHLQQLAGAAGQAADRPLDLPPILSGYTGRRYKVPSTGGFYDVTLNAYVTNTSTWDSRGTWYDITKWAARTHNCDKVPSSVACMACAMNMPTWAKPAGVVPIAVADELFGTPEKGATCSMCLRIYLPLTYPTNCTDHVTNPYCNGAGTANYLTKISEPWAWSGKIQYDPLVNMVYFTALIIEWFDREQILPYALTMPTQGIPIDGFGDWPVKYKAVPCPVGKRGIEVQFLDFSKPIPVDKGICNNQFGGPCGGSQVQHPGKPLGYLKLMLVSQRIPISLVEYFAKGRWNTMKRSGDGYWQPGKGAAYDTNTSPNAKMRLRIYCTDGSAPKEATVVPAKMLCSYQDPYCLGVEQPGVQC